MTRSLSAGETWYVCHRRRRDGGGGGEGVLISYTARNLTNIDPSHSVNDGKEESSSGFSPTRQTFACTKRKAP